MLDDTNKNAEIKRVTINELNEYIADPLQNEDLSNSEIHIEHIRPKLLLEDQEENEVRTIIILLEAGKKP